MKRAVCVLCSLWIALLIGCPASLPHRYKLVGVGEGPVTWNQANAWAEQRGGHLATITSAAEQSAVESVCSSIAGQAVTVVVGGFQPAGSSEPDGNWMWTTGEEWLYTNWGSGLPDNQGGDEAGMVMLADESFVWDDIRHDTAQPGTAYFLVEYEWGQGIR